MIFLEAFYFFDYLSVSGKIHTSGSDLMFEIVSVISNVILILGQISDIKFYGILLAFVNKFWTAFP